MIWRKLKNIDLILPGLYLLALAFRLLFLWQISDYPLATAPVAENVSQLLRSLQISQGAILGAAAFAQPPLYSWLLGLLLFFLKGDILWTMIWQAVIASTAYPLLYLLGRYFLNKRLAITAAVLAALYAPAWLFETNLSGNSLVMPLLLLVFLLLLRLRDKLTARRIVIAAVIYALLALCRPGMLIFLPCVIFYIYQLDRPRGLQRSISFLLPLIFLIAPVTLHNKLLGGDLVLISSNSGLAFYLDNLPAKEKEVFLLSGLRRQELEREATCAGAILPGAKSTYFFQRSLRRCLAHPISSGTVFLGKLATLLRGQETTDNTDLYRWRKYSGLFSLFLWKHLLCFPMGIIIPLALFGIFMRKTTKPHFLPLSFLAVYSLLLVLTQTGSLARLPLVPFLIIYAASAVPLLISHWREAPPRRRVIAPTILFHLLMLANLPASRPDAARQALKEDHLLATSLQQRGLRQQALHIYQRILRSDNGSADALRGISTIYLRQNKPRDAEPHILQLAQLYPDSAVVVNDLGLFHKATKNITAATASFKQAIARSPCFADPRINLGKLSLAAQKYTEAISLFRGALDFWPHNIRARLGLANAYFRKGDYADAAQELQYILRRQPQKHGVRIILGNCYWGLGKLRKSYDQYLTVIKRAPDNSLAYRKLARYYLQTKKTSRALNMIHESLRLRPNDENSQRLLKAILQQSSHFSASDLLRNSR